jgi:hypothetical protein
MTPPQRDTNGKEGALAPIFDLIERCISETGSWNVSIEEVCCIASIRLEDAYRTLYSGVSISGYVPQTFGYENVHDLITLLEPTHSQSAVRAFQSAGAVLDIDSTSELAALYYDKAVAVIGAHHVDPETFGQMLSRYKIPARAFAIYKDYFFDVSSFFEVAVTDFVRSRQFSRGILPEWTSRRHLRMLLDRHVVNIDRLFNPVFQRLTSKNGTGSEYVDHDPTVSKLLETLGLRRIPENQVDLREHYKVLMKTYHPDVNPSGLEISKRINQAYAELMTRIS